MSKKQKKSVFDRETEIQGAKIFGKHVSKEKGRNKQWKIKHY